MSDIAIMSHHHTKNPEGGFQEQSNYVIWTQIGVKMTHFVTIRVIFKNWTPSLFSKHNDVIVCKISKKFLGCIMRKAVYRPINNFE